MASATATVGAAGRTAGLCGPTGNKHDFGAEVQTALVAELQACMVQACRVYGRASGDPGMSHFVASET